MISRKAANLEEDAHWYKDAIIYELHVKTFYDSNDDGIGDFRGLTQKLDHLENLGITAVWLLPFYPSPLKDDGYDIANYFDVHPDYGTLRDFKEFLKEAHRRGIRVITELVLNHTSDQHEWFQKSRRAKEGSSWRNFYVWSSTPEKYKDARIIFKDFEPSNWSWDPVAKAYYWHRFYSHQPDLNFDHPQVQKVMLRVIDYWFGMGVDGMRLDAVPYLYEEEGTNCENLSQTYQFLKKLRAYVDKKYKGRMLLAEANQWPEDAVNYFGDGDGCHMAFHFPLMPRMFMAIRMENRYPVIEILDQTPPIPDPCQWALFLRNHDELTLEMVTDEERDYMYRIYAKDHAARINLGIRRRLAPLLEDDRRKIELMNFLLLSMPGTPVIYYGDEIGMGDNYYLGDRNGVRTPMQWSGDRNAGFSHANPQKLYLPVIIDPEYHYEAINVENQERSQASLLWWMRQFITMRNSFKSFGRGTIEFLFPENSKVLAFIRQYHDEHILVVVNLSKHPQLVELELSKYAGYIPEEVFSKNAFIPVKNTPYPLTLGSYGYYLFLLRKHEEEEGVHAWKPLPEIQVNEKWEKVLKGKAGERLVKEILPSFLRSSRWFGGKSRRIQQVKIVKTIPMSKNSPAVYLLFLDVHYTEGMPEVYLLPLTFAHETQAQQIMEDHPQGVIARVRIDEVMGIIYDGVYSEKFRQDLLLMVSKRQKIRDDGGELAAYPGKALRGFMKEKQLPFESLVLKGEQSNSSILYGNRLFLKLFRRLEEGMNSDLELLWFLTEKVSYSQAPPFAGVIEYRKPRAESTIVAILQGFIPNEGDAWTYTLDALERYFSNILSKAIKAQDMPEVPASFPEAAYQEIPPLFHELLNSHYLETIHLLGRRTGELHLALSSDRENPHFAPEPYSLLYQRSVYQSLQSGVMRTFQLLEKNLEKLPASERHQAEEVLSLRKNVVNRFKAFLQRKLSAEKIRIHGDYHLGQVLYTGKDVVIIDFEGEPARSLSERRLKRSPLQDVAGMLRSLHYAAYTALLKKTLIRPEDRVHLEPWADLWYKCTGSAFLKSYLKTVKDAPFIPKEKEDLKIMLQAFLLDKAFYEIRYELDNRPEWVGIPLRGVRYLVEEAE
ncbi:MAG: maltose alpha-D-glucosyltransferase [bacterium]